MVFYIHSYSKDQAIEKNGIKENGWPRFFFYFSCRQLVQQHLQDGYVKKTYGKNKCYSILALKEVKTLTNNMPSKLIEKMLKEIPLETRVKVSIQSHFIVEHGGTMLMPLDENGNELPEAIKANKKCFELAEPLVNVVLKEIKKWKEDGCP